MIRSILIAVFIGFLAVTAQAETALPDLGTGKKSEAPGEKNNTVWIAIGAVVAALLIAGRPTADKNTPAPNQPIADCCFRPAQN